VDDLGAAGALKPDIAVVDAAVQIAAALVLSDEVHQGLDAPGRRQGPVEAVAGESVMAAIWDSGLTAKLVRLRSLLAAPKVPKSVEIDPDMGEVTTLVTASHLVVEIEDLKRDLLGSGVSEEELAERVAPGVSGF